MLMRGLIFNALLGLICLSLRAADLPDEPTSPTYWPQWRGPLSTGEAPDAKPPLTWGEQQNIRWKTVIPGRGHSSPIVWGEHVFITTAVPYGKEQAPHRHAPGEHDNHATLRAQKFVVLAIRRSDGTISWSTTVHDKIPHEGGHVTGSLASNSPVTDGERLIAFFGSGGLYCLDMKGTVQWKQDLGNMETKHGHGEGSSPALYGNAVIINWDHEGQSFLVAYDRNSGKRLWKTLRDEVSSWATPIIVKHRGTLQIIVSGTHRLRGYNLADGKVIWECGGLSANIVCSPVAGSGRVFAGSSYGKQALLAIDLEGAAGDITRTDRLIWSRRQGTPYIPSLLLYQDSLFYLRHYQGILSRVDAGTGKDRTPTFRLRGIRNVYASPVAANGHIYITDLSGQTLVLRNDETMSFVSLNHLSDAFSASAALVEDQLYLRGEKHLYCIAEQR